MTLAELYRKEGEQRGIEKVKLEVAINALQMGLPIADVIYITGLSKKTIVKMAKNLLNNA